MPNFKFSNLKKPLCGFVEYSPGTDGKGMFATPSTRIGQALIPYFAQ
jgi:hypothetical protein